MDETYYAMQRAGSSKRLLAEMALLRLCDTSLDSSTDAILSRIAKLETAVAAGVTFRAPATAPLAEPVQALTDAPQKDVPVTPAAQAAPVPEQSLKLIRGWNEIAEQAAAGDCSVLAFVKMAKALMAADGRVYIKFPNDFARSMVDKPEMREAIRASLCLALSRNLSIEELILGVMEKDEVYTDLDELEL
jgi:DNA polymerase-3 subunit gamma/tau